jgi:hypothetical protein
MNNLTSRLLAPVFLFASAAACFASDDMMSKEQLAARYSFYGVDSLAGYDYLRAYKKAKEVCHITMEIEMKSFFRQDETRFIKNKYHMADAAQVSRQAEPEGISTSSCFNLDFEDGNYNNWTGAYGYNTSSCNPLSIISNTIQTLGMDQGVHACAHFTLISPASGNDPYGAFPTISSDGGSYCVRLGGDSINYYAQMHCNPADTFPWAHGEYLQQTIAVTAANTWLILKYAVILQNGGHGAGEQSYFKLEVLDHNGFPVSTCSDLCLEADSAVLLPGFTGPVYLGSVSYLPWSISGVDLTPFIGQSVTIRLTAAGCIYGGHFGYAYVDAYCGSPSIALTSNSIGCSVGGTATLQAPFSGHASYQWTGPGIVGSSTSQSVTVNATGTYYLTETPLYGCPFTSSYTVTASGGITATATGVNVLCYGGKGSASASVSSGTPPYSYAWSTAPVQTTITAINLLAGNYTVTVTDSLGCGDTAVVTITQPPALVPNATHADLLCNAICDGSAWASPAGGTGAYTYTWNTSPVQHGQTATGLCAATYTLTVRDANACFAVQTVTLSQPSALVVSTSHSNPRCSYSCDAYAFATPSGGTGAYTYLWSTTPSQSTQTISGLCAGTYTVTVSDANGCTKVQPVTVNQTAPILPTTTHTNALCPGDCNNTASVSATGGFGSYHYSWSTIPPQSSSTASNLCAGTYTVTVGDLLNCTATQTVQVTEPTALAMNATSSPPTCISCTDGIIDMFPAGGTPGYSFTISPDTGDLSGYSFIHLPEGAYYICMSDTNNCQSCDSIDVPPYPTSVLSLADPGAISFYPNPFRDGTTLVIGFSPLNYFIRITDALGREIYGAAITSKQTLLPRSIFPAQGMYFVTVSDRKGIRAVARVVEME